VWYILRLRRIEMACKTPKKAEKKPAPKKK